MSKYCKGQLAKPGSTALGPIIVSTNIYEPELLQQNKTGSETNKKPSKLLKLSNAFVVNNSESVFGRNLILPDCYNVAHFILIVYAVI